MFLVSYGFDLHDLTTFLMKNVVEYPELLNAQLPIGQFILAQSFSVSCFCRGLMWQLLPNGIKDDLLFKLPIGAHMVGGSLGELDLKRHDVHRKSAEEIQVTSKVPDSLSSHHLIFAPYLLP